MSTNGNAIAQAHAMCRSWLSSSRLAIMAVTVRSVGSAGCNSWVSASVALWQPGSKLRKEAFSDLQLRMHGVDADPGSPGKQIQRCPSSLERPREELMTHFGLSPAASMLWRTTYPTAASGAQPAQLLLQEQHSSAALLHGRNATLYAAHSLILVRHLSVSEAPSCLCTFPLHAFLIVEVGKAVLLVNSVDARGMLASLRYTTCIAALAGYPHISTQVSTQAARCSRG
jgi:hypothetical protein